MKLSLNLIAFVVMSSVSSFAGLRSYQFNSKTILLIDGRTGQRISDQPVSVYFEYNHPCLTDLIRPTVCVNGTDMQLISMDGVIALPIYNLPKDHVTAYNPHVTIQVDGACEGPRQQCLITVPLKSLENEHTSLKIVVPYKTP